MVGRFLQEDTYRGDGLNLYAYCANNPVVYYDPSGHVKNNCPPGAAANVKETQGNQAVNGGNNNSKPNQVHHFATDKNKTYTQQFKDIASNYGLDLDGDWNKESLPHQGRHPNAYHEYILDNMQKFDKIANGDKKKFLELFDKMKQSIIKNPSMLYKDYWEK